MADVSDDWQHVLEEGDRDAFEHLVKPHVDRLIHAARSDLDFYVEQGHLHAQDLTAEEVTGEALIHAWDHRAQRPAAMSLEAWLLGTQYRVLRGLVRQNQAYRRDKALSLDEPVTIKTGDEDPRQWFEDWYEPNLTLEAMTPAQKPVDLEAPLEMDAAHTALDPDTYHVLMMYGEFDMDLHEVAFVMSHSVEETSTLLEKARTQLRAQEEDAPLPDGAPSPPGQTVGGE